ncbi:MAG TPA: OmpA family protein [Kofleriaceae bacterium]|nr:OmpA family protein [Kofleriaceae bacterium]
MRTWMIVTALGLASCSQPVVFQGQSTFPVTGTPPAPVVEAKAPPRVEVRDNKIEIHEKIQFDFDKATIKEASFGLMNEIAQVIAKNPQIKRIRIEGHASAEGTPAHNKALSDERAKSVMKYLTSHGVTPGELVAVGYGTERPIADNSTEEGREKNRRVEFMILEQDVTHKKVEIDAKTGTEKVVEENHEVVKAPDAETSHEASKSGPPAKPATEAQAHKKGS